MSATGAARYTIPLTLPPGTNGLAPALAVTYDSRSGNGLLGVGFRLTGLSAIQRCGNTLAQDGRLGAVALDSADRFCLDGQRLRLTAGVYGQPGSQYQTERETFARVTAIGMAGTGPASFRVERSDGLIYEYGTTLDARVESANSGTPREWALNRIRDRNGNYADFVYTEDMATGSHRPLRIDYTGNSQTGAVPFYSVRFYYEARPAADLPVGFVAGGVLSESTRLDRIDIVHTATSSTVRSYDFTYAAPGTTGRSRLGSLQECVPGGCLAATQFGWSFVYAGWAVNFSIPLPVDRLAGAIPGDVDGDGFDDLTYHDVTLRRWMVLRGNGNGFHSTPVDTGFGSDSDPTQALSADLDGDGKRDVLVPGSGNYWHRLRHTSGGTYAYNALGVINPAPPGGLIAADIDGDGRDDLVYVKSAGDTVYWRRNQTVTSSSYAAETVLWSLPAGTRLPAAPFIETTQRFRSVVRSGDVNGDGRTDLLVLTQLSACGATSSCATWRNWWQVLASNGTALVPQHSFDGNTEPLLADFNADGLTDIAYWAPGGLWQLLIATGSRSPALAGFMGPYATAAVGAASRRPRDDHRLGRRRPHGPAATHGVRRTPVLPLHRGLARGLSSGRHQRGHDPDVANDAGSHGRFVSGPRLRDIDRPAAHPPSRAARHAGLRDRRLRPAVDVRVHEAVESARPQGQCGRRVPGARSRPSRVRGLENAARRQPRPGGGDVLLRGREAARAGSRLPRLCPPDHHAELSIPWCGSRNFTRTRSPTSASARRRASRCSSDPASRSRVPATPGASIRMDRATSRAASAIPPA